MNTDYGNVAPRLGFAYEAQPGLVVRGGYGITFMSGNSLLSGGYSNAPYTFNISCGDTAAPINSIIPCPAPLGGANGAWYLDGGLPVPSADLALVTDPTNYANEGTLYTYDFNLKSSYLAVELECAKGLLPRHGGYRRLRGQQRLAVADACQRQPAAYAGAPYPFPNLPGVTIADRESIMSSNYNALQTSLQRRLKSGSALT